MKSLSDIRNDFKEGYRLGSESADLQDLVHVALEHAIFEPDPIKAEQFSQKSENYSQAIKVLPEPSSATQKLGYNTAIFVKRYILDIGGLQ